MSAAAWINEMVQARCQPLCLEVDEQFHIRRIHGSPERYGLTLAEGDWACTELPVLYGLDCSHDELLEFVNLSGGAVVDLQLKSTPDGAWLLLLDARQRHDELQDTQQEHHEMSILRQRLERSSAQLREALGEAERANAAKSRFIAGMSHEFRTPLTAIQGYAERWLDGSPDSEEARAVQRACRYLVTLVDNLLEQGRINAAETLIQPAPLELAELVSELKDMFTPLTERRNLELRIGDIADLPDWVEVDGTRLRQIAVNLLGNACKFTETGFVAFELAWRHGKLELAVSDSGPGIPEKDLERVFGAFERVTEDAPGAGLGLNISRQLARRMGGDLTLQSTLGEGSCFRLTLKAPHCEAPSSALPEETLDIVLAEDDDALAMLFSLMLEKAGHRVARAENFDRAIALTREVTPQCLITDLNLPGGHGTDLIRRVRQAGFEGRIVTLTGSTSARDREKAMDAGADYFVTKPVELSRLEHVVHAEGI